MMSAVVNAQKAALRKQIRAALEGMPPATRARSSVRACARLEEQRIWRDATSILFFAPVPEELDLWPLLEPALTAGKIVALPRFRSATLTYEAARLRDLRRDVCVGRFGIREPGLHCVEVALDRLDLVLVPGLAFDLRGRRLGRGKGFYDRILGAVRGAKCGVAFDEQIADAVPAGPLDVSVNCLLTPTRWVEV
jgi:5-formyltetrahydrofolate cyclo-ligase